MVRERLDWQSERRAENWITRTESYAAEALTGIMVMEEAGWLVRSIVPVNGMDGALLRVFVVYEKEIG